jgi:hypothetical protein
MIRLIKFLITGSWHEHKWEINDEQETDIFAYEDSKLPVRFVRTYVQKCAVCGKLKSFKVRR